MLRGDGKSPRTIEGYADSVRQLASFLKTGGFPSLSEATAEHVREWLNELRNRGNKPATVNTRYRGVHAFYKWLVEEGELRENPLTRIQPPRVPETVQPYYTPEELQLVLKSLRGRRLRGIDAARTRASVLVLFAPAEMRAAGQKVMVVAERCWSGHESGGSSLRLAA